MITIEKSNRTTLGRRLTAGLAAVAAAVAVVGVANVGQAAATPTTTTVQSHPFLYAPTSLPAGFVEVQRSASTYGNTVRRVWRRESPAAQIAFTVVDLDPNSWESPTGEYTTGDGWARNFVLDEGHFARLSVTGDLDVEATWSQVKDSAQPDGGSFRAPLAIDGENYATVYAQDGTWKSFTRFSLNGSWQERGVRLTTDGPTDPNAQPTTARGLPALVSWGALYVEVEPGRWLVVEGAYQESAANLVGYAEDVVLDATPDVSWTNP
ncbi:hypothetical protein [Actinosynnema sp. NPDC020468]|uniref:hypothetical protein n=1 Tax=Actinosynnema sp. NPDC020468 TaxID=3154488 RepID=UPI003408EC13